MGRKYVISVSRRTEILGFPEYANWFLDKLKRGGCYARNPIVGKPYYVSLLPEDMYGFVFWTKNPGAALPHLDRIDAFGKPAVFFITITGYGAPWEPNTPPTEQMLEMARSLMDRYGPDHVWWRYDPVVLTERQDERWHAKNFGRLAEALRGTPRCVMSLLLSEGSYAHVAKRAGPVLKAMDDRLLEWPLAQKAQLLAHLGRIALSCGIRPEICAQPEVADAAGLHRASCMDLQLLQRAMPGLPNLPMKPTRNGCRCHETKDVGNFNTCDKDCLYCSANKRLDREGSIVNQISAESAWLWPEPLEMPIPPA